MGDARPSSHGTPNDKQWRRIVKLIWVVKDDYTLSGIGTGWNQSWGISRDERSGRWTLHDRRDDRMNSGERFVGYTRWHFASTEGLLEYLFYDQPAFEEDDLVTAIESWPEPARRAIQEIVGREGFSREHLEAERPF
jgi:hypothetical protein